MQKCNISTSRQIIRSMASSNEDVILEALTTNFAMTLKQRESAKETAMGLVTLLRSDDKPGLMEVFLAEYGLSTDEGIALMCLAEALLRVPDSSTMDDLIEDKLVLSTWGKHLGKSSSTLVNTATWGLLFTSKVLDNTRQEGVVSSLRGAIKRLGEPLVRKAVRRAMKVMGQQFVLGESIGSALARGKKQLVQGYSYSFDMLGEAALTKNDADKYFESYDNAIELLSSSGSGKDIKDNPGISIKLSALHPRYESAQQARVVNELIPSVLKLAQRAKAGNIGLNIDAEEADRLDLSLDIIQGVFEDSSLEGWDGFGVVVQAYNRSASYVLDWIQTLAEKNNRRIMVRLVKGAYWDSEIKRAQVEGLRDYPVFTRKASTDVAYLCCAKKLLSMGKRVFPQFATHNAHTIAAILAMANDDSEYEFQRLHGMGERLFELLRERYPVRCRIYAPVGEHRDLLAYLVRRLLENGANSSFVNQVVDLNAPLEDVVADPFENVLSKRPPAIAHPSKLFYPARTNSRGWDLHDHLDINEFNQLREPHSTARWHATPLIAEPPYKGAEVIKIINPADPDDNVGEVVEACESDVELAINAARPWHELNAEKRSEILFKVASLFEDNSGELFAILCREAGKTPSDVVSEVREAVDFLRYYATQAVVHSSCSARGVFVCISPWNFPLAIFTGQICAALAAGNGVLAKPAETTPLVAFFAIKLFHKAGVPRDVLQLLPGQGVGVGAMLVSTPKVSGVCFTGSTATGLRINRSVAENMAPNAPLIAETGGLNAMIVDSTALPEQAVADIVRSAFQSAGQRCSALRLLYIQEDVYDDVLEMLFGAIDELSVGGPWALSTDLGPLISDDARQSVQSYIDIAAEQGRLIKTLAKGIPTSGHFVAPSVIQVGGIEDMQTEVFGPVLHVAKFKSDSLDQIIDALNASGYGLTFGLHTRINSRVDYIASRLNVGNMYVNRDQVGAVVGSQPFGGENLSGTGPKAGGPNYLLRFVQSAYAHNPASRSGASVSLDQVQIALNSLLNSFNDARVKLGEEELPGPTGESNILYEYARGVILCLGGELDSANEQAKVAKENGCRSLIICPGAKGDNAIDGFLPRELLTALTGYSVVALWSNNEDASLTRRSLAIRKGRIIPLVCDNSLAAACRLERHVCIDTTAAGGNTTLLAMVG